MTLIILYKFAYYEEFPLLREYVISKLAFHDDVSAITGLLVHNCLRFASLLVPVESKLFQFLIYIWGNHADQGLVRRVEASKFSPETRTRFLAAAWSESVIVAEKAYLMGISMKEWHTSSCVFHEHPTVDDCAGPEPMDIDNEA